MYVEACNQMCTVHGINVSTS